MIDETAANWQNVVIVAIQTIGALATPIVLWYLARIKTLTNGNLHDAQKSNIKLRAKLDDHGINHDDA